jgi:hypothetical protein
MPAQRVPVRPVVIRANPPVPAWQLRAFKLIIPRLPFRTRRLLFRLLLRLLRPGSRVRRSCVLGLSVISWEATARRRYDFNLSICDPAFVWFWDANFTALGLDESYRGHEGFERSAETWNQIWTDISFTVREVLDGGDTLLQRVTLSGRGARSGVPTQMDTSSVVRLDPLVVAFYNFLDDAEALREAGFAPVEQGAGRSHP